MCCYRMPSMETFLLTCTALGGFGKLMSHRFCNELFSRNSILSYDVIKSSFCLWIGCDSPDSAASDTEAEGCTTTVYLEKRLAQPHHGHRFGGKKRSPRDCD